MNKLYTLLLMLLFLTGITACTDESPVQGGRGTILPNGDILLKAEAGTQGAPVVTARDIDPDGMVINNFWLLCFDESTSGGNMHHSYIGRRKATFTGPDAQGKYTFEVGVPPHTRVIHFVANLDLESFNAPVGIDETMLVPSLESASGRMTYWGRKEFASQVALEQFANSGHVELFYNQAKVSWNTEAAPDLTVEGFAVCNRRAWGTVAPFNAKTGRFDYNLENNRYVTNPGEEHLTLSPDLTEVSTAEAQYIFEDPNTLDEPVFAVMKIKTSADNGKYYKIMLVDANKNPLPIYRNMEYQITIKGIPTQFGYETFEEAKNGTAANNVWVSIDPTVPELSDSEGNKLHIPEGTTYVYTSGGTKTISFSYTKPQGISVERDEVQVSWLENDGTVSVSEPRLIPGENGNYSIEIELAAPHEQVSKAVLLLRAGVFTRQINVYLMKPLEFKPVWATTSVPQRAGELIAMTFVIPDSYPAELFPITCKIATNRLNPIDTLGVHYSVIAEDCTFEITHNVGTPEETTDMHRTNWGYKYVYTATAPGEQKLFLRMNTSEGADKPGTVDGCKEDQDIPHTHIFLQADYFKDEEYVIHFQKGDMVRLIRFEGEVEDPNNQDIKGYLEKKVHPTVNQTVEVPLFVEGGPIVAGTFMRISTTALHLLHGNGDLPPGVEFKDSVYNGAAIDYWVRFTQEVPAGVEQKKMFRFKTHTPRVNDYVRFFIDGGDATHSNAEAKNWFKSGMVKLISDYAGKPNFEFNFTMEDKNGNLLGENPKVDYGIGEEVYLCFSIPKEATEHTPLDVHVLTHCLKAEDPNHKHIEQIDGGWKLPVPQGASPIAGQKVRLRFVTTRIASAETVVVRTGNDKQALFLPNSVTFANTPVTGTMKLEGGPALTETSFIALERTNGTRVGVFRITEAGSPAKFSLTVRPEYDFTMDEELVVHYHDLAAGMIYQTVTTFRQLKDNVSLVLTKDTAH